MSKDFESTKILPAIFIIFSGVFSGSVMVG